MKAVELLATWRARAEELKPFAPAAAEAFTRCAAELEQLLRVEYQETLSLRDAARESGYNEDTLGKMVKDGRIPNVGRKNAPRIRRGDLPKKPTRRVANAESGGHFGRIAVEAVSSKAGR